MANTIECPNCKSILNLPNDKNVFTGGCPKCGTGFRIRNGKSYRNEEIVDNTTYCIVVLFAQIVRTNAKLFKTNSDLLKAYDNFTENFIRKQNLTKSQYNDIIKVYQNEKKSLFHEKTKDIIYNLKQDIDMSCKAIPMEQQEAVENNILYLLYQMTLIGNAQNEEQLKIINLYRDIFMFSEERIQKIINNFNKVPQEEEKKEINYEEVFNNIRNNLGGALLCKRDLINELIVAFKRPFLISNNVLLPKNIITVFSNEVDMIADLVSIIANKMCEELLIKGGMLRLDCSQYNADNMFGDFINSLNRLLNSREEIIVLENFKALSQITRDFLCDFLKKGFGVVNSTQGQVKINCNNKFFVFLVMGEQKDFIDIVGEDFFDSIGDVIKLNELTEPEIRELVANYLNSFVGACRRELEINLYYDSIIVDYIKNFYSKSTGMKSIKVYVEHNIHKPLVDYKLKMQPTADDEVVLNLYENELVLIVNNQLIKLSRFSTRKTNSSIEEVKAKLNSVIGLDVIKEYVLKLEDNVMARKMREEAGFKNSTLSMNMIFTGNPGTGKTTIARIISEYLKAVGVLEKGQLVEVTRGDLVGEHVGETASKTSAKINSALGGVLFIDEAYSLSRDKNDTFGLEAIDTLVKMMEDHKDDLVVILAGYKVEMEQFLKSNSGLKSRFPNVVEFPDYTPNEMYRIADEIARKNDYIIDNDCIEPLITYFETKNIKGRNDAGNGRLARNVVEKAIINQSKRIVNGNDGDLEILKLIDFELMPKEEFDLEENLKDIIGLDNVKEFLRKQYDILKAQDLRREAGKTVDTTQTLNMIFTGNPGTGKTTIARVVAKMLKEMGVLKSGHLVETDRRGLVAEYVGQTAIKTEDVFKSALGGILFIDEAYALTSSNDSFGREAVDTLVKLIEDNRGETVVIIAGYKKEMGEFLEANSGLTSRFPISIDFPDYNAEELFEIFESMVKTRGFILDEEAIEFSKQKIKALHKASNASSGNGRMARNFLDEVVRNQSSRILKEEVEETEMNIITKVDLGDVVEEKPEFDYEKSFEKIIGLESVKNYIRALGAKIKISKEREKMGLTNNTTQTLHMIFMGNPGTGKTMMARTVAEMLHSLGVISTNKLVETDRAGLVAGYVGQTAIKTTKKVEEALDGVLFIDEAYSLSSANDTFGKEAIDTLVKLMDDNRDRLVVILAGYTREMQFFLDTNSGLLSRFPNMVEFSDYSLAELMQIADNTFNSNGYVLTGEARQKLSEILNDVKTDSRFGNGRYVRNIFEKAITNQALRISNLTELNKEILMTILDEDIERI